MKIWMRIIAILEIIGGIIGIAFIIWSFLDTPINFISIILVPIPISIYTLSLVAGIALWRGSPFGRKASIIVQWIQLPKIMSPFLIFIFSFGLDFWINLFFAQGHLNFGVQVQFFAFTQFFINQQNAPFGFGISVTAAIFLSMLHKYKQERMEEVKAYLQILLLSEVVFLL